MATTLRWSPGRSRDPGTTTPTIKNHTATRIGSRLFVFGGYDGVRNHHAVHILDTTTLEWREAEVHVRSYSLVFAPVVCLPQTSQYPQPSSSHLSRFFFFPFFFSSCFFLFLFFVFF